MWLDFWKSKTTLLTISPTVQLTINPSLVNSGLPLWKTLWWLCDSWKSRITNSQELAVPMISNVGKTARHHTCCLGNFSQLGTTSVMSYRMGLWAFDRPEWFWFSKINFTSNLIKIHTTVGLLCGVEPSRWFNWITAGIGAGPSGTEYWNLLWPWWRLWLIILVSICPEERWRSLH